MNKLAFLLLTVFLFNSFLAEGQESTVPNDNLRIGKPINGEKNLRFNRSGPKVGLRWSETNSRMEFTNDGTNYKALGSGGGGGGGVNLLQDANFDFESGVGGWTASGGSFTIESASPLNGEGSGKFNASATAQTLSSANFIVLAGFEGRKCQVHIPYYKYESGSDGDYVLKVLDGEDTEIVDGINFNVTGATATSSIFQTFDCPLLNGGDDSDEIRVVIESTADAGDLIVDDIFLGQGRNVFDFNSPAFVGGITTPANQTNCSPTITGIGSWIAFGTDADCATWTPATSKTTVTGTQGVPHFTINDMKQGQHFATIQINYLGSTTTDGLYDCLMSLEYNDGTGAKRAGVSGITSYQTAGSQIPGAMASFVANFSTATRGDVDFRLLGNQSGGTGNRCQLRLDSVTPNPPSVIIYTVAESPVEGQTYDTVGWRVDASISGANPDLGTSSVATYTGITNGSLTLENSTGRGVISAQIPCSSTNPPTGTTCAAGDESLGVSFVAPKAQDVKVCAAYSVADNCNTGTGICSTGYTFKIAQTGNSDQIISASGGENVAAGGTLQQNSGNGVQIRSNMKVCGRFSLASSGQKTFRLMRVQDAATNISSSFIFGDAGLGLRDVRFTVEPINESMPTPVFDDLTSALASTLKSSTSNISYKGVAVNTTCSVSPCTKTNEYGGWGTVTRSGTGAYNAPFSGAYSSTPICSVNSLLGTGGVTCQTNGSPSINSVNVQCNSVSTGAAIDDRFSINCFGPE